MDDARSARDAAGLPRAQHRVSDRERDAVAERLRQAAAEGRLDLDELDERLGRAYSSRTYAELVPLTHDLPDSPDQGALEVSVSRPRRVGGVATLRQSWALMSGSSRRGHWVVPRTYVAVAVMGGIELDLTAATLAEPEVTIRAVALMGGVDVIVPTDVRVEVDGLGLMGGFEQAREVEAPPTGAPVVRVTGCAVMGGVSVRHPKPPKRKRLNREAGRP